jgi:phosphatidylglycerophosphatase A
MRRLLTSCFGLGWLPVCPGTWGSLPPAVLFVLMCRLGLSTAEVSIIMVTLVLLGSIICIKFASAIIATTNKTDPREIVADEFSGQAVTFLFIAAVPISNIWVTALLGFLLFRFFDILKPWPIRRIEKLPGGWGILLDDLLAGILAGIASLVCLALCSNWRLFGER